MIENKNQLELDKQQQVVENNVQSLKELEESTMNDLKESLSILEEANRAVSNLDKHDLIEIKSFLNPPSLVRMVMETVCILFHITPTWDNSRKLLSDINIVQRLIHFDKVI